MPRSNENTHEISLQPGYVDGRPYRVTYQYGWVVLAADGTNAFEPGWRWNTRQGARDFKIECEWTGHQQAASAATLTDHIENPTS